MTTVESADRGGSVYPPSPAAWWACLVLTLGCILAFLDRSIISLLITPIQRDLKLTDTQVSLLAGFAFALFNALFGLPVARWIDSGTRRTIAALGIAFWSVATAAGGLATNFWQLFTSRMAVGAGEAAVTPAGVSLIADYFPPARRGLAMGVFYAGVFIGAGGALLVGGMVWRALGDKVYTFPVIGSLHTWQLILIGAGALGLLIAPLTMTIREPRRLDGDRRVERAGVPIAEVARFYKTHIRALGGHNLAFCLMNFAIHGASAWVPTILVRTLGWSIPDAGATYGLMMLILGPCGSATSGVIADALARRGRTDGKLLVCIAAGLICAVACATIIFLPTAPVLLACLACLAFFGTFLLPMGPGALQEIMPNAMRGQAVAVYVGVINILAGAFAATLVALITDYVFHDPARLYQSFGIMGAVVCVLGALTLIATLAPYRRVVVERRQAPVPA